MIAEQLCPHCSIGEDAIPATEYAKELQRALGNLAATCKHLHAVANQHRFHSFLMPCDPDFKKRPQFHDDLDEDMDLARRFNNDALPALLDRMITHGQGQQLRYLSICEFSLQFKAGVTKARLIRFMAASADLGIQVPTFIPALLTLPEDTRKSLSTRQPMAFWLHGQLWLKRSLFDHARFHQCPQFDEWMLKILLFGSTPRLQKLVIDPVVAKQVFLSAAPTLPTVKNIRITQANANYVELFALTRPTFLMRDLLRSFPNVRYFQCAEAALVYDAHPRAAVTPPPAFPNVQRLVLDAEQPSRLHHLTQMLREFPNLEELCYHRRTGELIGDPDPASGFSNANVFDGLHNCLRKLTYSSTTVFHDYGVDGEDYSIEINCYEERRFSDVPSFGAFAVLEELIIDQGLLGRMPTIRDQINSPTGPHFPDLAWKLPQSLRRLTVQFVYDPAQLASQLTVLAVAKQRGQFPLLSDILVVIVRSCTVWYDGTWPPQIPLLPSVDVIRDCGELLHAVGINLWSSATEVDLPPGVSEDVAPVGTLIALDVRRRFFREM